MSMFDDVLGLGRTDYVNESVEPELANDDFDSVETLDESVDPMEYMLTAVFENEMNMVNIDNAIMCEEYSYLKEHGTEMIYEAVSISAIIEKAKKAVMSLWKKIQSFLKKAQDKLTSKMDTAFLRKYESKAKGKKATVNGYDMLFNLDAWKADAKKSFELLQDAANKVYRDATADKPVFPNVDEFMKKYEDEKGNAKAVFGDIKKSREMTTFSADKAIEVFKSIGDAKSEIKTAYEESKKNINLQLKALKRMESVAKKAKVLPTEASGKVHQAVKVVNKLGSALAFVNRMYIRTISMAKSQAKAVIIAAAAKDVAKESTVYGGYIDNTEIL